MFFCDDTSKVMPVFGACDYDSIGLGSFDVVKFMYLVPELEEDHGIECVEEALSYYIENSNEIGYPIELDIPDDFNYRVYYCSANEDILNNEDYLREDIRGNLDIHDRERLSIIHYMRGGSNMEPMYKYKVDDDFNEYMYRTFQKNTVAPLTEEDLYLEYFKKRAIREETGELVIGSKDDLLQKIGGNIDIGLDITLHSLCVRDFLKVAPAPDSGALEEVTLALENEYELVQMHEGVAGPGFVLGKDANVFRNKTYFTDEVYFGSNLAGVCEMNGDINLNGEVQFESNVTIKGSLGVSGELIIPDLIVTSNLIFRCDGLSSNNPNLREDVIQVVNTAENEYTNFGEGLTVPGAYFSSNMNVITKRTVFTEEVVFANGISSFIGCDNDGNDGNGGDTFYSITNGIGSNLTLSEWLSVGEDCTIGSNLSVGGVSFLGSNAVVHGNLEVHGDFLIRLDDHDPQSNDIVREALSRSDENMSIETNLNVPNVIFDKDITIVQGPIYFSDDVIFGKSLMTENCYSFDKEVNYHSNMYVQGELFADKLNVGSITIDTLLFETASNIEFSNDVHVASNLYVNDTIIVGCNIEVAGTVVADKLVLTDGVSLPVKPIDPITYNNLILEVFNVENRSDIIANVFDTGFVLPGAIFAEKGNIMSKPTYFASDVFFAGDLYRQETSRFTSNVFIGGELSVGRDTVIDGELECGSNVLVDGIITARDFNKDSDERIKCKIRNIDDDLCSSFIDLARVTEYKMKDDIGSKKHYGLIAQEVEQLNKNITNITSRYIPSIYREVKSMKGKIIFLEDHNVSEGDKLLFQSVNKTTRNEERNVTQVISLNSFRIDKDLNHLDGRWMLYGPFVDDFRSVDYIQVVSILLHEMKNIRRRLDDLETNA